ncbi:hypothetical protein [Amycolatopsis nigrescens]|uniref:hypothetical protein n=1 Tax=Amycolatopsis nigrescens TaxID=381445 RepID=UPI00037D9534|nr:hypothetical protein [Amycolatopsis nigrescens]
MTTAPPPDAGTYQKIIDEKGPFLGQAQALVHAATTGNLRVEPEAAEHQLAMIRELSEYLRRNMQRIRLLSEPLPISSTAAGKFSSDLMVQVAAKGEVQGFLEQVTRLQQALPLVEDALVEARKRYQETEEANKDALAAHDPEQESHRK